MIPAHFSPGCTCTSEGESPRCRFHGYEAVIRRLRNVLREWLDADDAAEDDFTDETEARLAAAIKAARDVS